MLPRITPQGSQNQCMQVDTYLRYAVLAATDASDRTRGQPAPLKSLVQNIRKLKPIELALGLIPF